MTRAIFQGTGTAPALHGPPSLLMQLKPKGGRMVVPAGLQDDQRLMLVETDDTGSPKMREVLPVRFLPLVTVH